MTVMVKKEVVMEMIEDVIVRSAAIAYHRLGPCKFEVLGGLVEIRVLDSGVAYTGLTTSGFKSVLAARAGDLSVIERKEA